MGKSRHVTVPDPSQNSFLVAHRSRCVCCLELVFWMFVWSQRRPRAALPSAKIFPLLFRFPIPLSPIFRSFIIMKRVPIVPTVDNLQACVALLHSAFELRCKCERFRPKTKINIRNEIQILRSMHEHDRRPALHAIQMENTLSWSHLSTGQIK